MAQALDTDYLVVGAGASGMAFADALVDHSDAHVVLVDRRHGPGGHWLEAYPFVRLHQASVFYGVASTPLGEGQIQQRGPEKGLHERATAPEICAYYVRVLERLVSAGRVTFLPGCEWLGDDLVRSRVSGAEYHVRVRGRVVDGRYLQPEVPASTPAPFGVADGANVVPVNELVSVGSAPGEYVVVGSGKTATDACIWLLENGVDPDEICWVRPRDPWMLNRAVIQPDPAAFLGAAADTVEAAAKAPSLDDLFLQLEDAGVLLRIDRSVLPTMAKAPTLAGWELDRLRSIERVVRLGHVRGAEHGRLVLDGGTVGIARDALVVHCAASGLQNPPLVPIWGTRGITLQPIRSGFPCFAAALAGYVEATRGPDPDLDMEKNRLCPPSPYGDSRAEWARMQVLGFRAATSFGSEPDIAAWAQGCLLNPSRIPPERRDDVAVQAARQRFETHVGPGMSRMAEFAGLGAPGP